VFPRDDRVSAVAASMRRAMLLLTTAVAILLACTGAVLAQDGAPASLETPKGDASDRYIVVLRDDASQASERVASDQARRLGLQVRQTYRSALKGYAARIPAERLDEVRADPSVAYVEPDKVVKTTEQTLPYGIGLIDADVSSTQAGNGEGEVSGVNAYIIDTGIDQNNPTELNVVEHVNFAGARKNRDCNGHGTHVAGTVAARDNDDAVVGVVPGAPLTGVKVLNCNGSGYMSDVIKGVDWVTENAKKPAIANMSLGGRASKALDTAVRNSADSGVFYAVAAGNEGSNACKKSPARAGRDTDKDDDGEPDPNGIVTVAATDRFDKEASFSNRGSCVDIWAPGVNVLSTKLGGGTVVYSGTSMASPHAGGTGALYLSKNPDKTPNVVEEQLKADSVAPGTKSKNGDQIKRIYAGKY
jgi:aqualysin 1